MCYRVVAAAYLRVYWFIVLSYLLAQHKYAKETNKDKQNDYKNIHYDISMTTFVNKMYISCQ